MAVGFGAGMVAAVTVGFLGMHAELNRFNQLSPWIIYSFGMGAWGLTWSLKNRQNS